MAMSAKRFSCTRLLVVGAAWIPVAALAQQDTPPQVSQPVIQPLRGGLGIRLNTALTRLARNPQEVEALLDAGKASLELGDVQAAVGFYQRAAALAPGNARIKAGLAGAYVLSEDPFSAIPLFDEAGRAGPIEPERLADRGLAYDLVGDNPTAQTYYRQTIASGPGDEALRRLALSQAIAGDRKGMDATLSPLLQRQDRAAWRTRAFGLAILGNTVEAETIARQTMSASTADAISAYLRYMPRLTPAQQAAAANLGHFPRAAQIGRDDPRLARYARPRATVASAAQPGAALGEVSGRGDTSGEPDRANRSGRTKPRTRQPQPAAPPEPKVGREVNGQLVQVAVASPQPGQPVLVSSPSPPATPAPVPPSGKAPAQAPPARVTTPGFASLDQGAASGQLARSPTQPPAGPSGAQAATVPAPAAASPAPGGLDAVFAGISPPSHEVDPAAGAVDMRQVRPVAPAAPAKDKGQGKAEAGKAEAGKAEAGKAEAGKAKAKAKEAKAPPQPRHPSRIWVQVATGRNKKALGFDWSRMVKADPAVFKDRKGFISSWGQTNRLLAGPFESEAAANAFITRLRKAGVGGAFLWTSPAGQMVDALPAGR